jgi:hypothetical protein
MKKTYKHWLVNNGYAEKTASGRPSSVYDYIRGLRRVCQQEHLSVEGVAKRIDKLLPKYQPCGKCSNIGRSISRSVRSSLAQFRKFVIEQRG